MGLIWSLIQSYFYRAVSVGSDRRRPGFHYGTTGEDESPTKDRGVEVPDDKNEENSAMVSPVKSKWDEDGRTKPDLDQPPSKKKKSTSDESVVEADEEPHTSENYHQTPDFNFTRSENGIVVPKLLDPRNLVSETGFQDSVISSRNYNQNNSVGQFENLSTNFDNVEMSLCEISPDMDITFTGSNSTVIEVHQPIIHHDEIHANTEPIQPPEEDMVADSESNGAEPSTAFVAGCYSDLHSSAVSSDEAETTKKILSEMFKMKSTDQFLREERLENGEKIVTSPPTEQDFSDESERELSNESSLENSSRKLENSKKPSNSSRKLENKYSFMWKGHASSVYVTGAWVNWEERIPLRPSDESMNNWEALVEMPENLSETEIKFIVNDEWMTSPELEIRHNEWGAENNLVILRQPC